METQPGSNPISYASPTDFNGKIQAIQYISSGIDELRASPTAIVYYGADCCKCQGACCCVFKCSCDCGDNYLYNTLVCNGGVTKYLYKNLGRLDCKICAADNMARFAYVKSFNVGSYAQIGAEGGTEFVEMTREPNCIFCGICSYFLFVNIKSENRMAGIVRYRGCCDAWCSSCCKSSGCCNCYNYYYCFDVMTPQRDLVYTIYVKRCCLSCLPLDCCGEIDFAIKNASGNEVGAIHASRTCCVCCGLRGKNVTYTITFPPDATPEMKLTIINGVISFDIFYF